MSPDPERPHEPERSAQDEAARTRRKYLVAGIYWLGALSLGGLVLFEILDIDTPLMRGIFMGGLFLAGTGILVLQAQRTCPHCGGSYGYYPRLIRPNICRRCGGEFPPWGDEST